MKSLLHQLLTVLAIPTQVNDEISYELNKKCLEARDYAGWVKTNKKLSQKN